MEWLMGKARGVSRGIMGSACPPAESPGSGDGTRPVYTEAQWAGQQLCPSLSHLVDPFPPLVHTEEWLASHTIGLFDNVSSLYDAVYELCLCTVMTGPGSLSYVATDERGKKLKCTAKQYMDSVLAQSHELIKSQKLFPTRQGDAFPADFRGHVTAILRNLLRVLAHLYSGHFGQFVQLELVPHLNTVARHLFALAGCFSLVDEKELEVLGDLQIALNSVASEVTELGAGQGVASRSIDDDAASYLPCAVQD